MKLLLGIFTARICFPVEIKPLRFIDACVLSECVSAKFNEITLEVLHLNH